MSHLTIGQVAERSGFPSSTLRFYERRGLVSPVRRSDAGYRLYDDAVIERLSFVARAKALGCTLDEIADLATLWEDADCGPVQRRLHQLVTAKIAHAQHQTTETIRLTTQLHVAASHLERDPVDGPCDDSCACLGEGTPSDPTLVALGSAPTEPDLACTLASDAVGGRLRDWQSVLTHAGSRTATVDGGLRIGFRPELDAAQLTALAVAEQGCCAFFTFAVTIDGRGVGLEVRAPSGADDLVTAVFGAPG